MDTRVASWSRSEALNALSWLAGAGVDTIVADEPRSWLEAAFASPAPVTPTTLEKSENKLIYNQFSETAPSSSSPQIRVEGDPGASIMLIMAAGFERHEINILPDAEHRLLGRMMAAVGLSLDEVIRVGLPSSPVPSSVPDEISAHSAKVMLLLGDGPCKALLGQPAAQARGRIHDIRRGGGIVPAIATFSPHFLIQQPRMKALAWADLLAFAKHLP